MKNCKSQLKPLFKTLVKTGKEVPAISEKKKTTIYSFHFSQKRRV